MKLTIDTDEELNAEQFYGLYVAAKKKEEHDDMCDSLLYVVKYFDHLKFTPEYRSKSNFENAKELSGLCKVWFEDGKKDGYKKGFGDGYYKGRSSKAPLNCDYNTEYAKRYNAAFDTGKEQGYKEGYEKALKEKEEDSEYSKKISHCAYEAGKREGYEKAKSELQHDDFVKCINALHCRCKVPEIDEKNWFIKIHRDAPCDVKLTRSDAVDIANYIRKCIGNQCSIIKGE